MTYLEAIDALADDPHVWRYRQLVDSDDSQVRDAWRARLVRMARDEPEPGPEAYESPVVVVPEADPWLPRIRACDDWNAGCCSHPAPFCSRFMKDVSREDCVACLTATSVKVFGIGLPKTGTNTLTVALNHLGFRPALHCPWSHVEIALCGSATDLPVAYRFKAIARIWPDAKFIYTTRNLDDWLASSETHFTTKWPVARERKFVAEQAGGWALHEAMLGIFGTRDFDRRAWLDAYHRHEADVCTFFADQSERLLITDLTSDADGEAKWQGLCGFLGVPVPDAAFPHENKTAW